MQDVPPIVFPVIGGLLSLLMIWLSLRSNRLRRLVVDTPTSKTTGVFIGFNELKGQATSPRPHHGYLSGRPNVHYRWSVDEHWSRTTRVRVRGSDGKYRTKTRRESGWKTVDSGGKGGPFYLQDDHGQILIRPSGAEVEGGVLFSHTCGRRDPFYYAKGPRYSVSNSDHRRRFVEHGIPLGAPIYVLGQAREREDIVAAEIAVSEHAPEFLISTRSEDEVAGSRRVGSVLYAIGGAVLLGGGTYLLLASQYRQPEPAMVGAFIALATVIYALVYTFFWGFHAINGLIRLRNRARHAFSLIEVQLKRRADLIPKLVEVAKAATQHERETQADLADLRAAVGESDIDEYHPRSQKLFALAENYPEFATHQIFLELQGELADTENRIALARNYYNDAATFLNTRIQSFPDTFLAGLAGVRDMPLHFAENDEEREVPRIEIAEAEAGIDSTPESVRELEAR